MNKTADFPVVRWITLNPDGPRGTKLKADCARLGIKQVPYVAKRADTSHLELADAGVSELSFAQLGCMDSHFNMLAKVALEQGSGDEWALICEDDTDFGWIDRWQFTWNQAFARIPMGADFVVLFLQPWSILSTTDVSRFFRGVAVGEAPRCLPGIPGITGLAYMVRRRAARAAVSAHVNERGKWLLRSFPRIGPSDMLLADMARLEGLFCAYTLPLFGEADPTDSTLGTHKLRHKLLTILSKTVSEAVANPEGHDTRVRLLKSSAGFFWQEYRLYIVLSLTVTILVGTQVMRHFY